MTKPRVHESELTGAGVIRVSMPADFLPDLRAWAHTLGHIVVAVPGAGPDHFVVLPDPGFQPGVTPSPLPEDR